ncbi:hypothetical protein MCOR24_011370 [Pyricularia oryzae]|uniref:Secreted protein n=1 Tax=Pyricularia oryzae TaxID=318829 RepID=A0A4P7NN00_PYROR|nr:hypothetical protein MCOR24_011370 [Pyricularia oryzae]QBZ63452.1 hypothetical protein PoMZ_05133 [Pyricularia oryzae]
MSHAVTSSACSFAAVTALIFLGCRTIPRPPPVVYHIKQHPGKGGGQNVRLSLFPGFKGALTRRAKGPKVECMNSTAQPCMESPWVHECHHMAKLPHVYQGACGATMCVECARAAR